MDATPLPFPRPALIPIPTHHSFSDELFELRPAASIRVRPGSGMLESLASDLAGFIRQATGFALPLRLASPILDVGDITLDLCPDDSELGEEGYELSITPQAVLLSAPRPAGLFYAIQTLLQLLPVVPTEQLLLPTGIIRDFPRFPWRGFMLDVARHFFPVEDVKHVIDLLALYKFNRFHMHLSDDQGWRIEIKAWPELTHKGSQTQVGGGQGGYYTQEQYKELVAYAQERYITLIPEVEMPSHSNAALASYPELNPGGIAPGLYSGIEVGFSTFDCANPITYRFLDEVIGELAALTPGPYIHIGGDEAASTKDEDYIAFIARVQEIVARHGKQTIGWVEMAQAQLLPGTIVQHWGVDPFRSRLANESAKAGSKLVLSPSGQVYLDMKYIPGFEIGLDWSGTVEVQDSYCWDPGSLYPELPQEAVLGIEAALWTETIRNRAEIELMSFPRLAGVAEIAWSPKEGRNWDEYRARLAVHSRRWTAQGINFYRSAQIDWNP